MKSRIKSLISLRKIVIYVIAIVAIATSAIINIKGVTKNYTNNNLNYQFSYNSTWHISTDLSRKFDEQSFLLGLYIKAGCNVSDFINDESSGLKNFQACIKKSPKFKESESTYSEFKKNWNIENTQYLILTKLSKEEESKLAISVFPALINQQWPQGSFVMIRPLEYKLDFPQEDPNNSSGLSRTFVNIKDLKGYATDIRGTKIASKDLSVSVPYATEKSVYSGAKIQSMIFSTTASKDSRDEKVFYGILKSFSLL